MKKKKLLIGVMAACATAACIAAAVREGQGRRGVSQKVRRRMEDRMRLRMDQMPEDFPPRIVRDHVTATRLNTEEILRLLRERPQRDDVGAGKAEVFKRKDGKWAWHIKAANGRVVATDGSQGYNTRADAKKTVAKVMSGEYAGPIDEVD